MQSILKALVFSFFLIIWGSSVFGQSFEWARSIGTNPYLGNPRSEAMVVDENGNSYVVGQFENTVDFDPGSGIYNVTSQGSHDLYILKLDSTGQLVWVKTMGGTSYDFARTIEIDHQSDLVINGFFQDTVDFDPGFGISNLYADEGRLFTLKIDTSGNFVWAKNYGSTANGPTISASFIDDQDQIYLTGYFGGTGDFEPGIGVTTLSGGNGGGIFILKTNALGDLIWAKALTISNSNNVLSSSINVDASHNVFTTGAFQGVCDFDPGSTVNNYTSNGERDIFIHKLDSSGNFIWVKTSDGNGDAVPYSSVIDKTGRIITTGFFKDTVDFNPGPGVTNKISNGGLDIFIQKLDTAGNLEWVHTIGGTSDDFSRCVKIDSLGNLYLTGSFVGNNFNFSLDSNQYILNTPGNYNAFVLKIDSSTNLLWAKAISGINSSAGGWCMEVDKDLNIFLRGIFNGSPDFDPDSGSYILNSIGPIGTGDLFILKLSPCFTTPSIDYRVTCDSLLWYDGKSYSKPESEATFSFINSHGCDSVVTLNLTILSDSVIDFHHTCDSLNWIDGNTYFASVSGPTHSFTNMFGCDSIVTLDLTIESNSEMSVVTSCQQYQWNANNQVYNVSGQYIDTLINAAGCDSITSLNLTILNVDTSITMSGPKLTSNAINAQYQWLNCDSVIIPIVGADSQSFTPTVNGIYAVEVTENGCVDTSACYTIVNVGSREMSVEDDFTIYPNPTTGNVTIKFFSIQPNTKLILRNALGQIVMNESYESQSQIDLVLNVESDVYFLEIIREDRTSVARLIKQ